jgi:hypothetical protein
MTTISDIARAADVSVESVLRVINRDNVSSEVASRVVAAMEAYGYGRLPRRDGTAEPKPDNAEVDPEQDQSRPRAVTGEVVDEDRAATADPTDAIGRAREQLLHAVDDVVSELENPGSVTPRSDASSMRPLADQMAIMDALLHRLAHDLEGMKQELGRARSERLEDLTLLVDLVTTSWRAVDRRLGRIDRKLERMEALPEPRARALERSAGSPGPRHLRS